MLKQAELINIEMNDGMMLNSHLFKPPGQDKCPLMIFTNGSGATSYETDLEEKHFYFCRTLVKGCIDEGFALLLVNKRGGGSSESTWKTQSFYDRAEDTHAIILLLRKRFDIDEQQISVMGHSQGGWIAQLLASRYPELLKSALSIAGPAYSVKEQILDNLD